MEKSEITEIVNNILIEEFEIEESEIKAEANLFDDLELDSLDGIDLIVALEKAFKAKLGSEWANFKIEEDKAKEFKTVGNIYDGIDSIINV